MENDKQGLTEAFNMEILKLNEMHQIQVNQ